MTQPGWIDQMALEIAQKIAADHKLTDSSHFDASRVTALIQTGAIEALKYMALIDIDNEKFKRVIWCVATKDENDVFHRLCTEQELSQNALFRQMLRHYQLTHERLKAGETCTWSGDEQRAKDFAGPLARPISSESRALLAVLSSLIPKERWSCSDDASGTALTLGRQIRHTHAAVKAAFASSKPIDEETAFHHLGEIFQAAGDLRDAVEGEGPLPSAIQHLREVMQAADNWMASLPE